MIDYTIRTRYDHRYASNCASLSRGQFNERLNLESLKWTKGTYTADVTPLDQVAKHIGMFHLIGA